MNEEIKKSEIMEEELESVSGGAGTPLLAHCPEGFLTVIPSPEP